MARTVMDLRRAGIAKEFTEREAGVVGHTRSLIVAADSLKRWRILWIFITRKSGGAGTDKLAFYDAAAGGNQIGNSLWITGDGFNDEVHGFLAALNKPLYWESDIKAAHEVTVVYADERHIAGQ